MRNIILLILSFFVLDLVGQANNSFQAPSKGGCETTYGTRNQIRALATSSQLEVGCNYIITGYSRGCLTTDEIVLTATAINSFSMDAEILTAFDTDYWEARYDINTNRVVELSDNRGNKVNGASGNEVDRFAWGQSNVSANTINNSDVYMDCTTTATINENEWNANAYTDLRGMAGIFEDNTIEGYGRVYMNGVTGVDFRRNTVSGYSYLYFNGSNNILFRQNNYTSNSYVRKFAGSDGLWTMYDCNIGRGDTRSYDGVSYIDELNCTSGGRLYMREKGTQDIRNTTISDNTYVNLEAQAGTTRLWRCNLSGLSYFYIRTAVTAGNRYYYSHIQSGSTYDYRSGSGNITMTNNNQNSNGYVRWDNISGTYRIYQNNINSRSEHRLNGTTGTHSHYYNNISNYIGRINLTNCTGSNIQRTTLSEGRIDATGGNPKILYCDFGAIGIAQLTNYTGTIQRTVIKGDSYVRMTGTGNMYACTFGTSFDFRSTNLNQSYITAFGNRTHTAGASNNNRGYFHNLVNDLL